jgi:hypothetical protein
MAMPTIPKTVLDRSLKLVRAPFDAALSLTGAADSSATHLLDRIEAGTRSATGVLFHDEELRREGQDLKLATKQRERAADLREEADQVWTAGTSEADELAAEAEKREEEARRKAEQEQRAAEKRERDRKSKAAETANKRKKKAAKKATKAKRKDKKVQASATLQKAQAKDQSLDAKEAALAAEREAEQIKAAAAAAKEERKNGTDSGA